MAALGVAWSSSIGSASSTVRTDAAELRPCRSWSKVDEREDGRMFSSWVWEATDEGRLEREWVEADEVGRLGACPVLIADGRGRPAAVVWLSVEGGRDPREVTMGLGAGVGVELGDGVGEAARRSVAAGRVFARRDVPANPARSRADDEAERPAAARVSFCCRGFGGTLLVVLEGRDGEKV